ncbi:MAG: HAD family hydrolase [Gemmatimonadaceae bacterium]|nr:HAD family hydrolase [Gemmatimonadaceae bacterium]
MSSENALAIFDIDGTLTDTNAVDDECYCCALGEALELTPDEIDWADAPYITDSGITNWLWEKHRHRSPTRDDVSRVRSRFVELLSARLSATPQRFAAVPGARTVLPLLRAGGWHVALATGAWGASAALKLRAAEVSHADAPLACADDASTREEIVQIARRRGEVAARTTFQRVVSVGDGTWDVRTARALEMPFVGVGTGDRARLLREAGATIVIESFDDWAGFRTALSEATIPETGYR